MQDERPESTLVLSNERRRRRRRRRRFLTYCFGDGERTRPKREETYVRGRGRPTATAAAAQRSASREMNDNHFSLRASSITLLSPSSPRVRPRPQGVPSSQPARLPANSDVIRPTTGRCFGMRFIFAVSIFSSSSKLGPSPHLVHFSSVPPRQSLFLKLVVILSIFRCSRAAPPRTSTKDCGLAGDRGSAVGLSCLTSWPRGCGFVGNPFRGHSGTNHVEGDDCADLGGQDAMERRDVPSGFHRSRMNGQ